MIYQGHFYDINENKYTVKITTDTNTGITKEITLGDTPFVSEIEGDANNVYAPIKCGLATVRILTDDYAFDIYTGFPQRNKIELLDANNKTRWIGYATPNLYTQGYENEVEVIEIEAMDGLASLKYIDYTTIGEEKAIVSFREIIDHLIKACGTYTSYYISNANQYDSNANYPLIQHLYISEANFFDEDDKPMSMKEVLEQICLYLSLTCVAQGDIIYFLDYDALKKGNLYHYKYALDGSNPVLTTQTSNIAINGEDYAKNGGTLSLSETYNKATVNCSLYSFNSIIPSVWDESHLTNYMGEWGAMETVTVGDPKNGGYYYLFYKWLKSDNYKTYYYSKTLIPKGDTIPDVNNYYYAYCQNFVGATIVYADFKEVPNFDVLSSSFNSIDFTKYILIHNHDTNPVGAFNLDEDDGLPVFESNITNTLPALFGGDKMYIIITGNVRFMDKGGWLYLPNNYQRAKDNFNPDRLWIKCKFQFGNKYWDGENWIDTETCFKLPFWDDGQTEHCVNVDFPIRNNISWKDGLDAKGYAIPIPDGIVMADPVKFTLYQPHRFDPSYEMQTLFISDFDITAKVGNPSNLNIKEDDDTDTKYANVIDENYVNEAKEVTLKICSWDNKNPNYSCVAFKRDSDHFTFLREIYNKGTQQTLIPEEQIIYRMVNQYKVPNVVLDLNLHNNIPIYSVLTDKYLPNRTFIVGSYTTDWEMNTTAVKIIEKQ